MKSVITFLTVALLASCSLPHTTVRSGSSQPGLIVKDAPDGSTLFVDGLSAGPATQYDGNPNVLAVLEGTHRIEVRQGTSVIYSEKAFVGVAETHTILVVAGSVP